MGLNDRTPLTSFQDAPSATRNPLETEDAHSRWRRGLPRVRTTTAQLQIGLAPQD